MLNIYSISVIFVKRERKSIFITTHSLCMSVWYEKRGKSYFVYLEIIANTQWRVEFPRIFLSNKLHYFMLLILEESCIIIVISKLLLWWLQSQLFLEDTSTDLMNRRIFNFRLLRLWKNDENFPRMRNLSHMRRSKTQTFLYPYPPVCLCFFRQNILLSWTYCVERENAGWMRAHHLLYK